MIDLASPDLDLTINGVPATAGSKSAFPYVRGRIGKITHEPTADGTLGRLHHGAIASVRIESTSRSVDENQAELFGTAEEEE